MAHAITRPVNIAIPTHYETCIDDTLGLSNEAPIGIVADDFALGPWLGGLLFIGVIVWLYSWMLRTSDRAE